ncbi:hypothetical protein Syun_018050 [Stephania yunnanensis]|uniref:Uncharacterized protein n=1 Tax=Stephania yunnanensis TaxID=152371 RepID=A0AAP0IRK1_9MAGN
MEKKREVDKLVSPTEGDGEDAQKDIKSQSDDSIESREADATLDLEEIIAETIKERILESQSGNLIAADRTIHGSVIKIKGSRGSPTPNANKSGYGSTSYRVHIHQ